MLGGKESNANNRYRLPPPNAAAAIRAVTDFVDLDPKASGAKNFQQTAEIIAGLDGVVTVDTSVAHLAGAMGKPVWLLNRFDSCWRWFLDREDSPWYPSVRIYRQERMGDWQPMIERVRQDLLTLAGTRAMAGAAPFANQSTGH
jgi:ADP-heptose:LPS heptosyltransferase